MPGSGAKLVVIRHTIARSGVVVPEPPPDPPPPPPPDPGWRPPIVYSYSPNFTWANRTRRQGVTMHSTNGGSADHWSDYRGTLSWFANPASQVSAHATIAPDGTVALHIPPEHDAWHDSACNPQRLGIEIAKPARSSHVFDEQLRSAAWLCEEWAARFGFPIHQSSFPQHFETTCGRAIGKIDIAKLGGNYSWGRFATFFSPNAQRRAVARSLDLTDARRARRMTTQERVIGKCPCSKRHSPKTRYLDRHHIHFLSWGGAQDGEQVAICQTSHALIHRGALIWQMSQEEPLDYFREVGNEFIIWAIREAVRRNGGSPPKPSRAFMLEEDET